ncbi:MAG: threonine dehydratase, partial [Pseudorhodobacter sp.]
IVDCSEAQIADGLRHLAWGEKMIVEGSAGLALAAWQADGQKRSGQVSAIVLCGANFDRDKISPIIAKSS